MMGDLKMSFLTKEKAVKDGFSRKLSCVCHRAYLEALQLPSVFLPKKKIIIIRMMIRAPGTNSNHLIGWIQLF